MCVKQTDSHFNNKKGARQPLQLSGWRSHDIRHTHILTHWPMENYRRNASALSSASQPRYMVEVRARTQNVLRCIHYTLAKRKSTVDVVATLFAVAPQPDVRARCLGRLFV